MRPTNKIAVTVRRAAAGYLACGGVWVAANASLMATLQTEGARVACSMMSGVAFLAATGFLAGKQLRRHGTRVARLARIKGRQAANDELTGLLNRRSFGAAVETAICGAHGSAAAVLFLDLVRFKKVNDLYGHAIGDQLLRDVARRLADVLDGDARFARHGGDEFLLLLPKIDAAECAKVVAERIMVAMDAPFFVGDKALQVSVSIGVALYPLDGVSATDLVHKADIAMYRAKQRSESCCSFYCPEMLELAARQITLDNELYRALNANGMSMCYQVKVDGSTGACVGVEALVRWLKVDGSEVPPADFIAFAEESGLITQLTEWVLRKACQDTVAVQAATGRRISVAVNVSPLQLVAGGLDAMVASVLQEAGLPPDCLEIEITEGVMLNIDENALRSLSRLRSMGVRVTLDDFGTGHSSLLSLKKFKFSGLKLDRAFVDDILSSPDSMAIAQSVISLARELRMTTVAEGVETPAQAARLLELGCGVLQGYLYGRPLPVLELIGMLNEKAAPAKGLATRFGDPGSHLTETIKGV